MAQVTIRSGFAIVPGAASAAAAALLGAELVGVVVSLGLWVLAPATKGWAKAAALLAAPLALAAASPLTSVLEPTAALWLAIAVGATLPIFLDFGGGIPLRRVPIYAIGVPLLIVPLYFFPWSASFTASDITARAQVLLLAIATIIILSVTNLGRDKKNAAADATTGPRT